MSNSSRSHRRRKRSNAGRVGLLATLAGVLGIVAVAVGIVVLQSGGDDDPVGTPAASASESTSPAGSGARSAPTTGPPLSLNTPEGYGYSVGAAKSGLDDKPLQRSTAPPAGTTYAYAEYVLTNTQQRPVLLDFPVDLFVPRLDVPAAARQRCMPQAGVAAGMCTLPNHSQILARLNGSASLLVQDGDTLMPPGASYLVRIATDLPVTTQLDPGDIRLYVWDARFTSDRKGIELAFP